MKKNVIILALLALFCVAATDPDTVNHLGVHTFDSGIVTAGVTNTSSTLIGTSTALDADVTTVTTAAPLMSVVGGSATQSQVGVVQNVASAAGVEFFAFKTRAAAGSTNANTVVSSGDDILNIAAYGADGAAYRKAAGILMESGGTPGSSDMPGQIVMCTTPDGSATCTTALTLGPTQLTTAAAGLTVTTGDVTATAGEFISSTSGKTLALQEATAGAKCMGSVTANGTTAVPVTTTCATTGSRIFLSPTSDPSGSTAAYCWATNIVNGTSFDVNCDQANDGTLNWIIFHEAA